MTFNPCERNPVHQIPAKTNEDNFTFACSLWNHSEEIESVDITYQLISSPDTRHKEVNVITKDSGYPYFQDEVRDAIIEREGKETTINF